MSTWDYDHSQIDPYLSVTDMRETLHDLIFGSVDTMGQGRPFILRELTDTVCPACWSKDAGNTKRANCVYCSGEGYQFRERLLKMIMFQGVAPIYKPAILGSGQYPNASYGYSDPEKATVYCEYSVWPNYERYTLPSNSAPNKLFGIKVGNAGEVVYNFTTKLPIRTDKWKILSVTPIYGDQGRLEYHELGCEKEVIS
jgi:hypothetical protein